MSRRVARPAGLPPTAPAEETLDHAHAYPACEGIGWSVAVDDIDGTSHRAVGLAVETHRDLSLLASIASHPVSDLDPSTRNQSQELPLFVAKAVWSTEVATCDGTQPTFTTAPRTSWSPLA